MSNIFHISVESKTIENSTWNFSQKWNALLVCPPQIRSRFIFATKALLILLSSHHRRICSSVHRCHSPHKRHTFVLVTSATERRNPHLELSYILQHTGRIHGTARWREEDGGVCVAQRNSTWPVSVFRKMELVSFERRNNIFRAIFSTWNATGQPRRKKWDKI